jgi:hypothetical protein
VVHNVLRIRKPLLRGYSSGVERTFRITKALGEAWRSNRHFSTNPEFSTLVSFSCAWTIFSTVLHIVPFFWCSELGLLPAGCVRRPSVLGKHVNADVA